ncbi:MAG TPA: glycosyltransferase family 39 protein [Nitrososphaeraceae archaeon]|nr:glycosyltransferase family 39 protein [Nitrososphaeraceae archaeon]
MIQITKSRGFMDKKVLLIFIPLVLSSFTSLWNITGYPSLHVDEGHYMRKAMSTLQGEGLQPQDRYFAPYFGQILLAGFLGLIGYPDILNPSPDVESVESLYLVPRLIMGLFAILDTFLLYKITEKRYGFKIALLASILFAVIPYGWLLRRIFLESIQLPLLLTSILLALYIKKDTNIAQNHKIGVKNISLILLSGAFLGLAIFTKVPIFVMMPLVGYVVLTQMSSNKLKSLGLWLLPVILIPMIWPIHAYSIGDFDTWVEDVLHQTQRESKPLINSLATFLQNDPITFSLGMAGILYAAIRKDIFILLFSVPFLLFLYWLDFVSSFHIVPLFPVFSIAAARLIVDLSNMIPISKIKNATPIAVISVIAIIGLVSIFSLITINANSVIFKTHAILIQHLQQSNNTVTMIGNPLYVWMPRHVFDLSYEDRSYYSTRPLDTPNFIVIDDSGYKKIIKENSKRGTFHKDLFTQTHLIENIKPDKPIPKYNLNIYPYSNLKQSPILKEVDIRANY